MSSKDKLESRIMGGKIPNDLSHAELKAFVESCGCIWDTGGEHPYKVVYIQYGCVIPIPKHDKAVPTCCIREVRKLISRIKEERGE